MSDFVTDFLRGQQDCSRGIPHESGKGDNYDRGYSAQYEAEAIMDEMTNNRAIKLTNKGDQNGY